MLYLVPLTRGSWPSTDPSSACRWTLKGPTSAQGRNARSGGGSGRMKDGEDAAAEVGRFVVVAVDPAGGSGQVSARSQHDPLVGIGDPRGGRGNRQRDPSRAGRARARRGTPWTRASRQTV